MLTQLIPPFKRLYPDVTIEISEMNVPSLTKMILEENIDCGIMSKKGSTLRVLTDQIIESAQIMLSTVCETNSIIASRSMVAMGIGVALIGESCSTDREHIAYYSVDPPLYRLNAFVRRKNWVMNNPENYLREQILGYFSRPAEEICVPAGK